MSSRMTAGRAAALLAALCTAVAVPFVVLLVVVERSGAVAVYPHWLPDLLLMLTTPWLGALVLSREPRNRFGWLLVAFGLFAAADGLASEYIRYAVVVHPGALPAAAWVMWLGTLLGSPSWFGMLLIPQLFPDGRTMSARWERFFRASVALVVAGAVASSLSPGRLDPDVALDNPVRVPAGTLHSVEHAVGPLVFVWAVVTLVGAFLALVLRFRRSHGAQRRQMKAFMLALFLAPVLIGVQDTFPGGFVLGGIATVGLPVALAVAILRHGLYDIDRIISRTVSYALLTGLLVGVYVACVAVTTGLLPFSSAFGVAASTLVAAALFQPLRRRLQSAVDRRFNRARYDAVGVVEHFSVWLRDEVHLAGVPDQLLDTVQRTVQPAVVSLWLPRGAA